MTSKHLFASLVLALLVSAAHGQEVVLKVSHFLPANSNAQQGAIQPWCDRIANDSGGRLKCQIFPAMQLGGTPPQLVDQLKNGVADVVWTLPSFSSGRFPVLEAMELPFMLPAGSVPSSSAPRPTPAPIACARRRGGRRWRRGGWADRLSCAWGAWPEA